MEEYQQRVIDEQEALVEKIVKLTQFTLTDKYRKLTVEERNLLIEQHGAMSAYNHILADRIAKFS